MSYAGCSVGGEKVLLDPCRRVAMLLHRQPVCKKNYNLQQHTRHKSCRICNRCFESKASKCGVMCIISAARRRTTVAASDDVNNMCLAA